MKLNQKDYEKELSTKGFFMGHYLVGQSFPLNAGIQSKKRLFHAQLVKYGLPILLLCLLLSPLGHALIVGPVKVTGIVVSYNKEFSGFKKHGTASACSPKLHP